jgi:HSP20 family molecular chaperone IbpA
VISDRKDAYLVTAELPGVKPDDVEITFEEGLLTIQGERHSASYADGRRPTGLSAATAPSAVRSPCPAMSRPTR